MEHIEKVNVVDEPVALEESTTTLKATVDVPDITLIRSTDGKRMPWKNGLGETTELAIYPDSKDYRKDEFIWRLAISEVLDSCSFSVFPNYSVAMLLLPEQGALYPQQQQGRSLSPASLHHNDHEAGVPLKPLIPYVYQGEWPTQCRVNNGPLKCLVFMANSRYTIVALNVETICPHGLSNDGHCGFESDVESGFGTPNPVHSPKSLVAQATTNAASASVASSIFAGNELVPPLPNRATHNSTSKILLGHFTIIYVIRGAIKASFEGDTKSSRLVSAGQTLVCERHEDAAPTDLTMSPLAGSTEDEGSHIDATILVIQANRKRERRGSIIDCGSSVSMSSLARSRRGSIIVYDDQPLPVFSPLESQLSLSDVSQAALAAATANANAVASAGNTANPGLQVKFWESAKHYRPPVFSARYQNESDVPPPMVRDDLLIDEFPKGKISTLWINMVKQGLSEWLRIPVIVARGTEDGPVVGITAAVHGNELNGVPCIHRVISDIDVHRLKGTVVACPCINVPGYLRFTREFSDGKDLNRVFPGAESGTASQIYCYQLMQKLIHHFEYLIDLHTASFGRVNSYYVRSDMNDTVSAVLAKLQQPQIILHSSGQDGTLRGAAMQKGIKAITVEIGNPQLLQNQYVQWSYLGVMRILNYLNMFTSDPLQSPNGTADDPAWLSLGTPPPPTTIVCSKGFWIYTRTGGVLEVYPAVNTVVRKGALIARIKNIFGNIVEEIFCPSHGVTIGRSSNPVAMAGDRVMHLGILRKEGEALPAIAKENY
ncbi:hypothetical protein BJ742DRAFT_761789 [Cladochytrium replicatum]|nr:hypothetical protein BJ742DRAFT_761789 [Cladochytrium replicatum]